MKSLNFTDIASGKLPFAELVGNTRYEDLRPLTTDLFETIQSILVPIADADITFIPQDAEATEGEGKGWTLGHIIVHLTAVLEVAAASAAMLARGVKVEATLRYETPWENIQIVQQLHDRLAESQRMCNAFLDSWPNTPSLDTTITRFSFTGPMNAIQTYLFAIIHAQTHFEQLRDTISQAQAVETENRD
jgi:hypothetical protein